MLNYLRVAQHNKLYLALSTNSHCFFLCHVLKVLCKLCISVLQPLSRRGLGMGSFFRKEVGRGGYMAVCVKLKNMAVEQPGPIQHKALLCEIINFDF